MSTVHPEAQAAADWPDTIPGLTVTELPPAQGELLWRQVNPAATPTPATPTPATPAPPLLDNGNLIDFELLLHHPELALAVRGI